MRINYIVNILILWSFVIISITTAKAQEDFAVVNHLVKLTVDTTSINSIEDVLYSDLLEIERKGFKRVYDSIKTVYMNRFRDFYQKQYTLTEQHEMLNFYRTTPGSKLVVDIALLYSRHLPEDNSLMQRLSEMRKHYKEGKLFESVNNSNSIKIHDENIDLLFRWIGVGQYLGSVKAGVVIVKDKPDVTLMSAFDNMSPEYLDDLGRYFKMRYSNDEIQKLLQFYRTPLGKKIAGNSAKLIKATIDSQYEWAHNLKKIMGYINMGKFQREHYKENKK